MTGAMRQVVALGGGGFSQESGNALLDDYVLGLTGAAEPDVDVIALNGMCFTDAPEVNWRPGAICPRE